MKVLLIKQTSLGDVLHCTPALRALGRHRPAADVTVVTDERCAPLLDNNPYVSSVETLGWLDFELQRFSMLAFARQCARTARLVATLRRERWDLILDLQGLLRRVVFAYGIPAPRKVVHQTWWRLDSIAAPNDHAIDAYLRILARAGIADAGRTMDLFLTADEVAEADAWLGVGGHRMALLIAPFSRWPSKDYPLDFWSQVIARLLSYADRHVVVAVSSRDRARLDGWFEHDRLRILSADLRTLAAVASRCRVVAGSDSFPMHLGCALGIPTLGIFGPTSESRTRPVSSAPTLVLRGESCVCLGHYRRRCPDQPCLRSLPPERVAEAIESLGRGSRHLEGSAPVAIAGRAE